MNGAESLVHTARSAGLEVCFSNPGTSEMPLVAALDSAAGLRAVLVLFEGVASGAADGYARMAERPALTLFHLGPGHGNATANLHNARRARSPLVNLVGDQATWHRRFDPPLASDIAAWAAPVSGWYRENGSAARLAADTADAIAAAWTKPGCVATLTVPTDSQWSEVGGELPTVSVPSPPSAPPEAVTAAARALRGEGGSMLLLGGWGARERGLRAASRIAAVSDCRLGLETFPARWERGPDLPLLERVPYFPEQGAPFFAGVARVVLAGATDPVAFFGYPSEISRLVPEGIEVLTLASPEEDVEAALEALADELGGADAAPAHGKTRPPAPTGGALDPQTLAAALAAHQPEGAIVIDEGITSVGAYLPLSSGCPRHSYLALTGGAIGWGLPAATGAAIACPDRKVVCLEGDGSGLYTAQALWTQAREGLDVVNLVFVNDIYRILQIELHRAGVDEPGPQSRSLTDLGSPAVDWQSLARSYGVPSSRVATADELNAALARAFAAPGPHLIEVRVP